MKHDYHFELEDIILKPLSAEESELYRQLRNREDNAQWFETTQTITRQMQQAWYQGYLERPGEYMFSIYERSTGAFLGAMSLYHVDPDKKQGEIGRVIIDREKAGGKGYALKVVEAVCRLGYEKMDLNRIYAEIYSDNYPSLRIVEQLGFWQVGKREALGKGPEDPDSLAALTTAAKAGRGTDPRILIQVEKERPAK